MGQAIGGYVMAFDFGLRHIGVALGQSITGKLVVGDENVVINVDLPWLLTKIAGTVKEKLAKGTQVLLEKK